MGQMAREVGFARSRTRWAFPLPTGLLTLCLAGPAVGVSGCQSRVPSRPLVTDSLGVTVVSNEKSIWGDEVHWRLSEDPAVQIGGATAAEEYQIYQAAGALKLPDGRILIANRGTHQLRYYDAHGRFLKAVGRQGGGPGEFGRLWSVMRFGSDSLLIWDPVNYRYAVLDLEGNFGRHFKFQSDSLGSLFFPGMDPVVFADRSFLGMAGINWMSLPSGVVRETAHYYRFSASGKLVAPVLAVPFQEMKRLHFDAERAVQAPVIFGKTTEMAALDSSFWVGTGDGYVLRLYAYDGRLLREARYTGFPPIRVTSEDLDFELSRRLEAMGDVSHMSAAVTAAVRKNLESMPTPETLPPYRDLLVDRAGNLWVEAYLPPGKERAQWSVFDSASAMLGTVTLPPRLELLEVGEDYVLGLWHDELDVEIIQVYALAKS